MFFTPRTYKTKSNFIELELVATSIVTFPSTLKEWPPAVLILEWQSSSDLHSKFFKPVTCFDASLSMNHSWLLVSSWLLIKFSSVKLIARPDSPSFPSSSLLLMNLLIVVSMRLIDGLNSSLRALQFLISITRREQFRIQCFFDPQ